MTTNNTHSVALGYVAWIFGFMGAHRFYFGKPISGTLYFFTFGFFLIGWVIDLFLIPSMDRDADVYYQQGHCNYSIAWVLLAFTGILGIHRMYMGKWISGILYFFTLGFFGFGLLYDLWSLNSQIHELNSYDD